MENITSVTGLKNAIQLLEAEQTNNWKLLHEQFLLTYESLKPVNLFKSTMNEVAASPYLIENIVGSAVGMATGYISRKIVVGASGNIFRKLLGSVIRFGVVNVVAKHPDAISSFSRFIFQRIFRKKEQVSAEPEIINES